MDEGKRFPWPARRDLVPGRFLSLRTSGAPGEGMGLRSRETPVGERHGANSGDPGKALLVDPLERTAEREIPGFRRNPAMGSRSLPGRKIFVPDGRRRREVRDAAERQISDAGTRAVPAVAGEVRISGGMDHVFSGAPDTAGGGAGGAVGTRIMAEGVGFEPTGRVNDRRFSRPL